MLPEKMWKTESVLRLMLGVFSSLCIGMLLASAVTSVTPGIPREDARFLSMIIMTLAFHGAALVWVHFFLRAENISWSDAFGFQTPGISRAVGLAVISGLVVLPFAWGLQQLSAWLMEAANYQPKVQPVVQELQKADAPAFQRAYLALVAIIAAPIVEEMIFRGILYPTIKQAGHPKLALWGTSILFGLTHGNVPAFFPLVFLAIILTLLYEETGNLLSPILAHSCFNLANFVMLLFVENFNPP